MWKNPTSIRCWDSNPQPVWPDWVIFESSWLQILIQKGAQIFIDFLIYIEKHKLKSLNCFGYFLATIEKIGLVESPKSGHTACGPCLTKNNDW